jgi:putative transcriptional regulator
MNNIKTIRERLGVTQAGLAEGMGCSQGNVSNYEQGQTIPPDAAKRLIAFAQEKGVALSFNDVYNDGTPAVLPVKVVSHNYTGPERRSEFARPFPFEELDRRNKERKV